MVSALRACRWIDCWFEAGDEDYAAVAAAADGDGEEFVAQTRSSGPGVRLGGAEEVLGWTGVGVKPVLLEQVFSAKTFFSAPLNATAITTALLVIYFTLVPKMSSKTGYANHPNTLASQETFIHSAVS